MWLSNDGKTDGWRNIAVAGGTTIGFGMWQDGTLFAGYGTASKRSGSSATNVFASQITYKIPNYVYGQMVHFCTTVNYGLLGLLRSGLIYVNGTQVASTAPGNFNAATSIQFAFLSGSATPFYGKLQCVSWYNSVLSATQILTLFNNQQYGGCLGVVSSYIFQPPPVYNLNVAQSSECGVQVSFFNNPNTPSYQLKYLLNTLLYTVNISTTNLNGAKMISNYIYYNITGLRSIQSFQFNITQAGSGTLFTTELSTIIPSSSTSIALPGNCDCYYMNNRDCLLKFEPFTCHINYYINSTGPYCASNIANDGCASLNNPISCTWSTKKCLWDPILSLCFMNTTQPRTIFDCSYWKNQNDCSYHGCYFSTSNNCTSIIIEPMHDSTTMMDYSQLASWSKPVYFDATGYLEINLTTPYYLRINNSIRYSMITFGQGVMKFHYTTGFNENIVRNQTFCGSQTIDSIKTQSNPPININLPNSLGQDQLMQYEINWIRSNRNIQFPNSGFGVYMKQVRNSNFQTSDNTIVSSVYISDDNTQLIYVLRFNTSTSIQHCSINGLTYSNISTNGIANFWSFPLSYWELSSTGQYQYNDFLFTLTTYAFPVIRSVVRIFPPNIKNTLIMKNVTTQDNYCPQGQTRLAFTYWLQYAQIDSPKLVIAVSYSFFTNSSLNNYNETIQSIMSLGKSCKYFTCITSITTVTECRDKNIDGTSFNGIHSYSWTTFLCPFNRFDDFGCKPIPLSIGSSNISFSQPQFTQYGKSIIALTIPSIFQVKSPIFQLVYGILPQVPNINQSMLVKSDWPLVGYVNTSYSIINSKIVVDSNAIHLLKENLDLFVSLKNTNHWNDYTVTFMTNKSYNASFSIQASNLSGNILYWDDIRPYLTILPRNEATKTCSNCASLSYCKNSIGCDGIRLSLLHLRTLLPSPDDIYLIQFTFSIQPYHPKSITQPDFQNLVSISSQISIFVSQNQTMIIISFATLVSVCIVSMIIKFRYGCWKRKHESKLSPNIKAIKFQVTYSHSKSTNVSPGILTKRIRTPLSRPSTVPSSPNTFNRSVICFSEESR